MIIGSKAEAYTSELTPLVEPAASIVIAASRIHEHTNTRTLGIRNARTLLTVLALY